MKALLAMLFFSIPLSLFAQIDINHIGEYKELIFSVQAEHQNSIGTAFIVGKNESHYYLATAKHVINGDKNVILTSLDGSQYTAHLVREHDTHDLALLQTQLLPIKTDRISVISDIAMNDEVAFISMKDSGNILPSKKPGIIRDVTDESLSLIMSEVDAGHSGSPIFFQNQIAGIIIKSGRFVECINISLAKRIIDLWGDGLFEGFFVEQRAVQIKLGEGISVTDKEMIIVSVTGVESANETKNLTNLVDGKLETGWSYSVEPGEEIEISMSLDELVALGSIIVYVSNKFSNVFPAGSIYFVDNKGRKTVYADFSSIFKEKERSGNGYWFVYNLPKAELATDILLKFNNNRSISVSYSFSEIQFYGIEL